MTEKELLEAYPLLKDKDFTMAKRSICNLMSKDDFADDRGHLTEYFNDTADNNDEMFFYEMLRALEFILEGATAYTTPDKRICLNYPNEDIVPMDNTKFRRWYFVFCHECLHQLWDTFAVADQIKKDLGSCDHQLLNIASDCVINEYLAKVIPDGKMMPTSIINADYIEDEYGIKYNMKTDTQYSLYCKLNELSDEAKNQLKQQDQDNQGQGQNGQDQNGQGQNGQDQNGQDQNGQDQNGQDQNGQNNQGGQDQNGQDQNGQNNQGGQGQGSQGSQSSQQNQGNEDSNSTNSDAKSGKNSSTSAAGNIKKKLDEAQERLDNGDIEGAKRLTQEAKEDLSKNSSKLSDKGKEKLNGANGKNPQQDIADLNSVVDELANNVKGQDSDQNSQNDDKGGEKSSKSSGDAGNGSDGNLIDRQLIEENRAAVEKICKKYAQSLSGGLEDFLKKCKSSKNMEEGGLLVQSQKGSTHWNKQLLLECDQYIHQKLRNQDRKFKRSFKKIRRGERAFTAQDFADGRTLKKGKVEMKDQIGFDIALYIDVSGSMCGVVDDVFDAAYNIVNTLKKTYSHDKLVDGDAINLKSYVFTTSMREIPFGKKCKTAGGTYTFEELLDDIYKRNANAFLNIVITDGDFSGINKGKVEKILDKMDGLFVVVSNKPKGYFTDLVNHIKRTIGPKLADIYADQNFTIS